MMDDMSPSSPIRREANMKAAQMGATAVMENVTAFYMGACPADILYISATEKLLLKWAEKRLEPLIDSCGIRELIVSSETVNLSSKNRRSGDKILSKIFRGGSLGMATFNSASSLRMDSVRILLRDEIDGAPLILVTGEGNMMEVSEARTAAWDDRAKVLDNSTPTIEGQSAIEAAYLDGDQRKYFVPCPLCGKFQELRWGNEDTQYGVKPIKEGGGLKSAYYQCDHCHDAIFNHQKTEMLAKGVWKPTAKSCSPDYRSRHISGIYRPPGMRSWMAMWQKYEKALDDPEKMRGFRNLDLGLSYRISGSRPKVKHVIELRGGYRSGTIPDGVLFLTAAVDVQRGSSNDPSKPARLEVEVCGHGKDFRTWSIQYLRFEGKVDDANDGAWEDLYQYEQLGKFIFRRSDGREFAPALTFIDSGDGDTTSVVYDFCKRWINCYPIKGTGALQAKPGDPSDKLSPSKFFRKFAKTVIDGLQLITISTILYKNTIYNNVKIKRQPTGDQKRGFCAFPVDYDNKYFDMLTSEERLPDGSYDNFGRRNEALDLRVYNLCACDLFLIEKIDEIKAYLRGQGATKAELVLVDHSYVLEHLRIETERKIG
jgi:phage terminase large subunit GpA-like protein